MSSRYDPRQGIDFTKDYYTILSIRRESLPVPRTKEEVRRVSDFLDQAYKHASMKAHPDAGGTKEAFLNVVQAHGILTNPTRRKIYDSGGQWKPRIAEDETGFDVDWSKIGTYSEGTLADTTGFSLCLLVRERLNELNLAGGFVPTRECDNYEWDWAILNSPVEHAKLSISIVFDAEDVLRLSSGTDISHSLPFKIYICIPRANLYYVRGEKEVVDYDGSDQPYVLSGKLQGAAYSDYNLLETTHLDEARAYVMTGGGLEVDLAAFRDETLVARQKIRDTEAEQSNWVDTATMKKLDTEALRAILRTKSVQLVRDETAADFLNSLPDNTHLLSRLRGQKVQVEE